MLNDPKLQTKLCAYTLPQLLTTMVYATHSNTLQQGISFDAAIENTYGTMKATLLWISANISPIPEEVFNSLTEGDFDD